MNRCCDTCRHQFSWNEYGNELSDCSLTTREVIDFCGGLDGSQDPGFAGCPAYDPILQERFEIHPPTY